MLSVAPFAVAVLALAVLTAVGARRRGNRAVVVVLASVFFPITWVVWYARDDLVEGSVDWYHRRVGPAQTR